MEAKVVKVGTSLGLVIPRFIAMEGGFSHGTPINIEFNNNQMIVTRKRKVRAGWAEAFAKYAAEGGIGLTCHVTDFQSMNNSFGVLVVNYVIVFGVKDFKFLIELFQTDLFVSVHEDVEVFFPVGIGVGVVCSDASVREVFCCGFV